LSHPWCFSQCHWHQQMSQFYHHLESIVLTISIAITTTLSQATIL
jgi:hypothetical protein